MLAGVHQRLGSPVVRRKGAQHRRRFHEVWPGSDYVKSMHNFPENLRLKVRLQFKAVVFFVKFYCTHYSMRAWFVRLGPKLEVGCAGPAPHWFRFGHGPFAASCILISGATPPV